jgi:regulator of cell morphogenesis and NO signaling
MSQTSPACAIAEATTVNEMIRKHPATVEVFNRFGIDACCGGAAPIRAAAQRDGADPEALCAELVAVLGEEA